MGRISMPQGKGSQMHNRREFEKIGRAVPDNIDTSLSYQNITLLDKDIRAAYKEIFGEALQEYNAKQKRADRKIEDYYDHISKSKNGEKLFYEDVLQWGKKEDFDNPETREAAKDCLVEYAKTFEKRNPNLKLIGAYIHMDEASPHLHLDYVPVAHGYSRGLKTRNSLDKAMKEMGFQPEKESRKNNATKLWKENERAVFGDICRSRGLEVEAERKARGSLSVEEYKEAKEQLLSNLEEEKEALNDHISSQKEKLNSNAAALDQQVELYQKRKKVLSELDEALEPIKDHSAIIHEETVRKGLKTENKTVVEGMTVAQVQKVFKLADIGAKAREIIDKAKQQAQKIIEQAKGQADDILKKAEAEAKEKSSIDLRIENAKLKKENNELTKKLKGIEKVINNNPDLVKAYQREEKILGLFLSKKSGQEWEQ